MLSLAILDLLDLLKQINDCSLGDSHLLFTLLCISVCQPFHCECLSTPSLPVCEYRSMVPLYDFPHHLSDPKASVYLALSACLIEDLVEPVGTTRLIVLREDIDSGMLRVCHHSRRVSLVGHQGPHSHCHFNLRDHLRLNGNRVQQLLMPGR